jgi:PEP-CTERM motif-containing protein
MKSLRLFAQVAFFGMACTAYASVIDDFNCANSVSVTGTGISTVPVTCADSLGGSRVDSVVIFGGTSVPVSTLTSGGGTITGTIAGGQSGFGVMIWAGTTASGVWALPNLNLTDQSVLVRIQSTSGGSINVNLGSGSVASNNLLSHTATFAASGSFIDVLIPLTSGTVIGTGADITNVTAIGLQILNTGSGDGTWAIDSVEIVPEPSTFGFLGAGIAALVGFRKKSLRAFRTLSEK